MHMARALTIEGRRAEAVERLDAALEVARATAITYSGPRLSGALALATEDPAIRQQALDEGEEILSQGCVGHNHFWFYRDGMDVALAVGDFDTVDRYAAALEEYTRSEPLPWTDFCIARGRALANYGRGQRDDLNMRELQRLRDEAERVGFKIALPALERALENRE